MPAFYIPPGFDSYTTAQRLGLVSAGQFEPDGEPFGPTVLGLFQGWQCRRDCAVASVEKAINTGRITSNLATRTRELVREAYRAGLRVWLYLATFPVQVRQLPEGLPRRLLTALSTIETSVPASGPADLRGWCEFIHWAMDHVTPSVYPAPLFVWRGAGFGETEGPVVLVDLVMLHEVAWLFPHPGEQADLDSSAVERVLESLNWSYPDSIGPDSHTFGRLRFNYAGIIRVTWVALRKLACAMCEGPPPEPGPCEPDHIYRNALDQVINWCRRHESATPRGQTGQRGYTPEEAEAAVRAHLKLCPNATIREVARATGAAIGRISRMPVWQAALMSREARPVAKPRAPRHRQLTTEMLASIGNEDDPAERLEKLETSWRRLLESATSPEERANLNTMSPKVRLQLIQAELEQHEELSRCDAIR